MEVKIQAWVVGVSSGYAARWSSVSDSCRGEAFLYGRLGHWSSYSLIVKGGKGFWQDKVQARLELPIIPLLSHMFYILAHNPYLHIHVD